MEKCCHVEAYADEKGILISFENKNKRKLTNQLNSEVKFTREICVECTTHTIY